MKSKILLCILCLTINGNLFAQWVQTTNPYAPGPIDHLAISGSNFFAGATCSQSHGSLFLSTNFGTSWSHIDGTLPHFTFVYSLYANSSVVLAGLGDTTGALGLYRSIDNGTSWTHINIGTLSSVFITSLFANGTDIFAGIATKGVYKSSDNGLTWTNSSSGLSGGQYYSFAVNGTNLFVGTNVGVFKSVNNGSSWTAVNTGLPSGGLFYRLTAIGGNVLAGTYGNNMYLTNNNGANWTQVSSLGLTSDFAIVGTKVFASLGGQVYLSVDNGYTWINVSTSSISSSHVYSLAIGNNFLFAGVYTVWKRPLNELTGVDEYAAQASVSVYPNPFSTQCTLKLDKAQKRASACILDAVGKVVQKIDFSGDEVLISRNDLKAGAYFVRVSEENNATVTRRLIIE